MALFSTQITSFAYSTLPVNPSGIARFVGRGLPNLITRPFRPNATIRAAVHSPLVESPVEYKSEDDLKFEQYVVAKVKQVNHELEMAVPLRYPLRLHESMRHTLLADSERVMSILCIASCELVGGHESQAMASACAIEMMHTMSLIHDDLPCMDDGELRRGKPANHREFDEATAVLAGDALFALAFEHIVRHTKNVVSPDRVLLAILEFSMATGPEGIQAGQMMDKLCEGRKDVSLSELEFIHTHKAAKIIGGTIVCGAILGGGTEAEIERIRRFGLKVGFLFQVLDDVVDATKSSQVLGKTAGNDSINDKLTFPKLKGIEGAKNYATQLFDEVLRELSYFDAERVAPLRRIITYVFNRQYM